MTTRPDAFDRETICLSCHELCIPVTDTDRPLCRTCAGKHVGVLAPIMAPDSLARIDAEYEEWVRTWKV